MEREKLKSRMGFILLSAGCAIGIGNVWKFPYIAGQGGGGAFVLFYLIFLIILGLPIMTMEFAVGRASRRSGGWQVYRNAGRPRRDDLLDGVRGGTGHLCMRQGPAERP